MIAEKTADAIRGRKLSPFEPPTRIATAAHYPNAHVPDSAIRYKPPPHQPPPMHKPMLAQYNQQQQQHRPPLPPPLQQQEYLFASGSNTNDDWQMASGDSESHYAGRAAIDRSITDLTAATSATNATSNNFMMMNNHQHLPLSDITTATATRVSRSSQSNNNNNRHTKRNYHEAFMLKHYAGSTMVDNLIKRFGPIR